MADLSDDPYFGTAGVSTPADHWYAVTLSDTELLSPRPKFLLIGHDGSAGPARSDLEIEDAKGGIIKLSVVPGQKVDVRPVRVRATNATAGVVVFACY